VLVIRRLLDTVSHQRKKLCMTLQSRFAELRKASHQDQSRLGKLASVPYESEFEPSCPLGQADCSRRFQRLTDVRLYTQQSVRLRWDLPTTIQHLRKHLTKRYRLNIPAPGHLVFILLSLRTIGIRHIHPVRWLLTQILRRKQHGPVLLKVFQPS
jgi:hypothetical protein